LRGCSPLTAVFLWDSHLFLVVSHLRLQYSPTPQCGGKPPAFPCWFGFLYGRIPPLSNTLDRKAMFITSATDSPTSPSTALSSPFPQPAASYITPPFQSTPEDGQRWQNPLPHTGNGSPTSIVITINDGGSTGRGILIGVLSAFGSAGVAVLVLAIFFFFKYTNRGRILLDRIGRPGEYDDEQAFAKEEAEALENMDELQRAEYLRAKGGRRYASHRIMRC
jgi:hypothetical protein